MQGMTPLEMKYHLKDIERSFAVCRTQTQAADGRQLAVHGWMGTLINWIRRPSAATLKRMVD